MAMTPLPLRLLPGEDLRRALEQALAGQGGSAAFVVTGIGSLDQAHLRFAGADEPTVLAGPLEILALAGTVSSNGSHVHVSVADAAGKVVGGHAGYGCMVRTTAEVLLGVLPAFHFAREPDPGTGHEELVVRRVGGVGHG